jgi:hypothetical protein
MSRLTLVTLVHGGNADARETAIASQTSSIAADGKGNHAAILEGLAAGCGTLQALEASAVIKVIRVAPGCPCCTGNLTMRITLNRVLRDKPARLFVAIADASHKDKVSAFLQDPQYREHLSLASELDCG